MQWSAISWLLDSALSSYSVLLGLSGDLYLAREFAKRDVLTMAFASSRNVTPYASQLRAIASVAPAFSGKDSNE